MGEKNANQVGKEERQGGAAVVSEREGSLFSLLQAPIPVAKALVIGVSIGLSLNVANHIHISVLPRGWGWEREWMLHHCLAIA